VFKWVAVDEIHDPNRRPKSGCVRFLCR
jgi:hypothetical protein